MTTENIYKRRILFDVTELASFDKGTGIQRSTKSIYHALVNDHVNRFITIPVIGVSDKGKYKIAEGFHGFNTTNNEKVEALYVDAKPDDVFLSLDLAYNMCGALRKELKRFKNIGVKIYFVIYDLIPVLYPHWFEGENKWFEGNEYLNSFKLWLDYAIESSNALICISKTVENDVKNWIKKHPPLSTHLPKIGHFYLGAEMNNATPSDCLLDIDKTKLAIIKERPTFLVVGTLEPRKGHAIALKAFERLWQNGYDVNLVFVGREGWNTDRLIHDIKHHRELGTRFLWLDGISDDFLQMLYLYSTALLALSEAEGFGLPLVEAANFKLPIIARDIKIFKEICGAGAFYVDIEDDTSSLFSALEEWLKLYEQKLEPEPKLDKLYSWSESAKQLIDLISAFDEQVE